MKRSTRILAFVLVLAMLTALFTGCGKDTGKSSATKQTTKSSATKSTSKSTVKSTTKTSATKGDESDVVNEDIPEWTGPDTGEVIAPGGLDELDEATEGLERPQIEPVNMMGRDITIIIPNAIGYMFPEEGKSRLDDVKLARARVAEQKFNCKITWEKFVGNFYKTLLNNVIAGTQWGDIVTTFRTTSNDIGTLVKNNVFYQLDDYIDFSNPFYRLPHLEAGVYNGKHYGFRESAMSFSNLMLYNKDIFAAEGLPDAFELQQSNAWTWDVFVDIAMTTTRDLNGDGINDQWGLENINGLTTVLLHSNSGDFMYRDGDGNYGISMSQPKTMRAYQFYSDLCNVYKVMSPSSGVAQSKYLKGLVATAVGGTTANVKMNAPQNTGYVMFPMGPDADRYMGLTFGGPIWTIPTYVQDPASTAALMAEIFSLWDKDDENSIDLSEALIGPIEQYLFCENDRKTFELYLANMSMPQYANFYGVYLKVTTPFFKEMAASNIPVISVIDKHSATAQAALDEILN